MIVVFMLSFLYLHTVYTYIHTYIIVHVCSMHVCATIKRISAVGLLLLFTTYNFLKSTIFALCADESISVIITICESSTLNGQQEVLVEVIKIFATKFWRV